MYVAYFPSLEDPCGTRLCVFVEGNEWHGVKFKVMEWSPALLQDSILPRGWGEPRVIHLPLKNYFFRYPTYTFFGVEVSCEEHLEAIWDNLVEIYLYHTSDAVVLGLFLYAVK